MRIGRYELPFPLNVIGTLIVLPILLVLGLLSIPAMPFYWRYIRWAERRFAARMRNLGRVKSFMDAQAALDTGKGTLIADSLSPKGPTRVWWTPNDVATECPQVWYDCDDCEQGDEAVRAYAWVRDKYTDPDKGAALLAPLEAETDWAEVDEMKKQGRCISIFT